MSFLGALTTLLVCRFHVAGVTEGLEVGEVVRAAEAVALAEAGDDVVDLKTCAAAAPDAPVLVAALDGVLGAAPDVVVVEDLATLIRAILASSLG